MSLDRRIQEQAHRLKKMGSAFLGLAILSSIATYALPHHEANYWLSSSGKEGMYVLSGFFAFLGFYCLGAVWRRRSFL